MSTQPTMVVESLNYFQSLTNESDPISGKRSVKASIPPAEPKRESPDQNTSEKMNSSEQDLPAANASEHFTLLAASLRDASNAERLVKKLQAKGYAPRMETIDMPESGRWTRVLVGSFDTREEALEFAAEFNRKENVQGLVVRIDL